MEAVLRLHLPHHGIKPISYFPSKSTFFLYQNNISIKGCRIIASSSSSPSSSFPTRHLGKKWMDDTKILTLDSIRNSLIKQEDSIIFSLLEIAQYSYSENAYDNDSFFMDDFKGSLVEYIVWQTEKLHAQVGRYTSPDEHAFFPGYLPKPMFPPLQHPQDNKRLLELLTYETVEESIMKRVEIKAKTFCQVGKVDEADDISNPIYKINLNLVANLYADWIMPLTKEVQVEYLLRRLD